MIMSDHTSRRKSNSSNNSTSSSNSSDEEIIISLGSSVNKLKIKKKIINNSDK